MDFVKNVTCIRKSLTYRRILSPLSIKKKYVTHEGAQEYIQYFEDQNFRLTRRSGTKGHFEFASRRFIKTAGEDHHIVFKHAFYLVGQCLEQMNHPEIAGRSNGK